ncbi:MAG: alpha/beta hydrolase [Gemmatimonadaceae bacterium]
MMSILAIIAGVIVLLLALIWWGQEKLVFFPQGPPYPDAASLRRIDYEATDGQELFAYVVGDTAGARGFLLCFHGNADLAVLQAAWARQVNARTGYSVVLAEYRGYAGLGGKPTFAGSLLDAQAAYAAVRMQLGAEPERIAFFGHSLGSAVAAELATRHEPNALLLKAPFTSAREMAPRVITPPLALAFRLISRVHYDTRVAVAAIDAPVWVVHGTRDGIIQVEMGRAVFEAAKTKGELLIVDDADHSDLAGRGGSAYWDWLERALK